MGKEFLEGLEIAKNNLPENSKFEYEILVEDDQMQASKTAIASNKLINLDKVDAIISTWSYGGNVVAPMLKTNQISHFSMAWDINILNNGSNNFLYLISPKQFVPYFFNSFERRNYKTAALLYFQEAGSLYFAELFKKTAKEKNIKIVYEQETLGSEDFKTIVLKLNQANPDIIFANIVGADLENLLLQLKVQKVSAPITTLTGFDLMSDLSLAEGQTYISDSVPTNSFLAKHNKDLGKDPVYGLGNYYDAVMTLVSIYESWDGSGKPNKDWVNNKIKNLKGMKAALGNIDIVDNIIFYEPQALLIKDGKKVRISLDEL